MTNFLLCISLLFSVILSFGQLTTTVLDSTYFYEGINSSDWSVLSQNYYKYNSEAKLIENVFLYKNGQHGWITEKKNYHYNNQRLQDTITVATWESSQNKWLNETQNIYKYNANHRIIRITDRMWNEVAKNWQIITITKIEYDEQNRWTSMITNDTTRRIRIFDENNQVTQDVFQQEENGQWSTLYSTNYQYNALGQIVRLYYYNDAFNPPNSRETVYTYNNLNRRTSQIVRETNAWGQVMSLKDTFIYDIDNQLVERQKAEENNDKWVWFNSKYLYEYDANENPIATVTQTRHTTNDNWQNSGRDEIFYNADDRKTDIYRDMVWDSINAVWYSGEWTNFVYNQNNIEIEETTKKWENSTNDYTENYRKLIKHFSEKTIEIITTPTEENCSFLNPYLPFSTIYCANWELDKTYQLKIFSIDGRTVYETDFLGCDGFRVEKQLQKGWYVFVVLDDGEIVQNQKILIFE